MIYLVESIELSNVAEENDNNSDSGISPNDSEVEILLGGRKSRFKGERRWFDLICL